MTVDSFPFGFTSMVPHPLGCSLSVMLVANSTAMYLLFGAAGQNLFVSLNNHFCDGLPRYGSITEGSSGPKGSICTVIHGLLSATRPPGVFGWKHGRKGHEVDTVEIEDRSQSLSHQESLCSEFWHRMPLFCDISKMRWSPLFVEES